MACASSLLSCALERIDAVHGEDPAREAWEGEMLPRELVYARRMSAWLERLRPDASAALRLAVRAQHLRRWEVPRERYPMDRAGYHRWRGVLARRQAETAGSILREVGYDETTIARVQALVRKEGLKQDPETQILEDAACLVFLENYFADFAARHPEDELLRIVRKTWVKMSPQARDAALALPLAPPVRELIAKALTPQGP
ncbi:MAG: DUF4202 domain-containing protein [Pseudomonadota bacterium]